MGAVLAGTRAGGAPTASSAPGFRCCLPRNQRELRAGIQLSFRFKYTLHGLGIFIGIPHPTDLTKKDLMMHVHKTEAQAKE